MSDAALGGPWTMEDHMAHPSFDAGLAGAIVVYLKPQGGWPAGLDGHGHQVTDWGGGLALYLDQLKDAGAWTYLVEPNLSILPGPAIRGHTVLVLNMAKPLWVRWGASYLTLCLEVLEHIERDRHTVAIDNVCGSVAPGGWLVFSAATPGQGGHGHIAERPESEWREELASRGLVEDEDKTEALRSAAVLPWFKANVMVWRRG